MNSPARYLLTVIILACLASPTTAFCKKKKKGKGKGAKDTTEQTQVAPSSPPTAAPTSAPPQISGNLTTTSGKTFEAVTVKRVDPDGLLILHKDGAAKVLFTDLPDEIRAKFGYDAQKAQAFQTAQAAAQKVAQENAAKQQAEMAKKQADEKKRKELEKKAVTREFIVEQRINMREFLVHIRHDIEARYWLITKKSHDVADGGLLIIRGIQNGTREYNSVLGAKKTVRVFEEVGTVSPKQSK